VIVLGADDQVAGPALVPLPVMDPAMPVAAGVRSAAFLDVITDRGQNGLVNGLKR
jgi:hypothetical protein